MNAWFRFYSDSLNDPKVQRLPGDRYKFWSNMLCIASMYNGVLPSISDMAYHLRMAEKEVETEIGILINLHLIDEIPGIGLRPHNWDKRQYKSDAPSTDRVRKHRGNKAPHQNGGGNGRWAEK